MDWLANLLKENCSWAEDEWQGEGNLFEYLASAIRDETGLRIDKRMKGYDLTQGERWIIADIKMALGLEDT